MGDVLVGLGWAGSRMKSWAELFRALRAWDPGCCQASHRVSWGQLHQD